MIWLKSPIMPNVTIQSAFESDDYL